jgi:aminomethyltransferase
MATSEHEGLVKTPLYATNQQLGARIVPFAGWAMPIEFSGTLSEHRAVRGGVGVFDVSHLGSVWITGDGAEAAIAATFTNDPTRLDDGASQYTLCCDEHGGIIDDLIVYRLAPDHFLAVPNAANTAAVLDALRGPAGEHRARLADDSRKLAMLAVQGPRSLDVMEKLFPDVIGDVPYRGIRHLDLGPSDDGWVCRTGYTGEVGVELVLSGLDAPGVMQAVVDLGATPAGLGARDTLRLEMGYPLHGNDLTTDTDPYEARLGWAVKLDRDGRARRFRGRDALAAKQQAGPSRRLWGLRVRERGIPRRGMTVRRGGQQVGSVTSGGFSPTLETGIGLAYLDDPIGPGDEVTVDVRGRDTGFAVVRPPFVDRDPRG